MLAWLDQSQHKGGVIATLESYLPAAKPATSCLGVQVGQPNEKKYLNHESRFVGKWKVDTGQAENAGNYQ